MFLKFWAWLSSFFKQTPMLQESLTDNLSASLARMGKTPDEVAEFLRAQKIQGWHYDVFRCPISCWLQRITPSKPGYKTYVCVSSSTFTVTYQNMTECLTAAHGSLPEAVSAFIHLFDYVSNYSDLAALRKHDSGC